MTILYLAAAILLPFAVVVALLGLDRLMQFGQGRRGDDLIFPMLAAATLMGAVGDAVDRNFGAHFYIGIAFVIAVLIGWALSRRKPRATE